MHTFIKMCKMGLRDAAASIMEAKLEKFHSEMIHLDRRISIDCQIPAIIGEYIKASNVCNRYLSGEQIEDFNIRFRTYLKGDLE